MAAVNSSRKRLYIGSILAVLVVGAVAGFVGLKGASTDIDPSKIVGLTIDAARLQEIRRQRAARLGGNQRAYAELLEIYAELEEAKEIHRRLGCPVIEISELSIEETAARVIRLVERRKSEGRGRKEAKVS